MKTLELFKTIKRVIRPSKLDYRIYLNDYGNTLEIFLHFDPFKDWECKFGYMILNDKGYEVAPKYDMDILPEMLRNYLNNQSLYQKLCKEVCLNTN